MTIRTKIVARCDNCGEDIQFSAAIDMAEIRVRLDEQFGWMLDVPRSIIGPHDYCHACAVRLNLRE